MKKLKRQTKLVYLERVRAPNGMKLKELTSFYNKLLSKYEGRDVKIIERRTYYSNGGLWIAEWQTESREALAQRQAKLNKEIAIRKARVEKYRAQRKAEALKERIRMRAEAKKMKAARKAAMVEKQVEQVKTMVKALELAGFTVSAKKAVKSASARG